MNNSPAPPTASGPEYAGPFGLFPVPYLEGVFNFHWFSFYNAICFQIILGAPAVLLAKDLGANSMILGIIAAFTPLMTVLQLPAARYLGRHSYFLGIFLFSVASFLASRMLVEPGKCVR